jgi:hypothetical protein
MEPREMPSALVPSRPVTTGREVLRADRLFVPPGPQELGKPPVCGPVTVPAVGVVPDATQSLAPTPASRA